MPDTITKPWGEEVLLTTPDLPYVGKIQRVLAGHRWSLQYHDQKTETFTLINGQAKLITGPDKDHLAAVPMEPNLGYTITPNIIHRLEAVTDCLIFEVSSPETGTTFRLEDDYHRPNETPEVRSSPNRGWQP